jgi:magnesium chelatase subunit H
VGCHRRPRASPLNDEILELEYTLIPHGLHVVGEPPNAEERLDMLMAVAESKAEACDAATP